MKLAELIADVDQVKPNQFDANIKTGWINEIEAKAVHDVINRAEGNDVTFTPYVYQTDGQTVLKIPDEHKDVYMYWLFSKIDMSQYEMDRYNIEAIAFSNAWDDYRAEYRREHMPK